jgi:hypothetical protein
VSLRTGALSGESADDGEMPAPAPVYITGDVEKALGRKPRTFDAWLSDNAAAFK